MLQAIAYAEDAIADRKGRTYGKWIRLAAKRFLRDLKRTQTKNPPFVFSADRACHACRFIERLPHVEGTWETRTIRLESFQLFFLVQLFGFRNALGDRRFSTVLFAIGRKNAKSTLAAAILLYIFCCEQERGPQVFSAATTGKQARIVFDVALKMVQRLRGLRETFTLEAYANSIVRYESGGNMRPINSKASTQDGLNPSALVLDELHAHKTHDLKNVLTSAAGARRNKLFLYTTTEGYESPGPWPEERHFAQQVLLEVLEAEHYLALLFTLDDADEPFNERTWIKANPLLDASPMLLDAIRRDALEAKAKPGAFAEFRVKRLNQRAETATGWVNLTKWRRCSGDFDLEEIVAAGAQCWGAFDLATTTDMCAWALLWKLSDMYFAKVRYWVPADATRERSVRNGVQYSNWIRAGYITETAGDAVDYDVMLADIRRDALTYSPRIIAFDQWNAQAVSNTLIGEGLPLQKFIQGPRSYNPAMKAFEAAYVAGKLRHAGNPVLTWNAANIVPRYDSNMNIAPDRKRSADRIDGAVALVMAFGAAASETGNGEDLSGFLSNPIVG